MCLKWNVKYSKPQNKKIMINFVQSHNQLANIREQFLELPTPRHILNPIIVHNYLRSLDRLKTILSSSTTETRLYRHQNSQLDTRACVSK